MSPGNVSSYFLELWAKQILFLTSTVEKPFKSQNKPTYPVPSLSLSLYKLGWLCSLTVFLGSTMQDYFYLRALDMQTNTFFLSFFFFREE